MKTRLATKEEKDMLALKEGEYKIIEKFEPIQTETLSLTDFISVNDYESELYEEETELDIYKTKNLVLGGKLFLLGTDSFKKFGFIENLIFEKSLISEYRDEVSRVMISSGAFDENTFKNVIWRDEYQPIHSSGGVGGRTENFIYLASEGNEEVSVENLIQFNLLISNNEELVRNERSANAINGNEKYGKMEILEILNGIPNIEASQLFALNSDNEVVSFIFNGFMWE